MKIEIESPALKTILASTFAKVALPFPIAFEIVFFTATFFFTSTVQLINSLSHSRTA